MMKVTSDFTDDFNKTIKSFKRDAVLVGIPQSEAERDDSPINNATLLAINEFGSPLNNIPARPVVRNGIKNTKDEIAEQFKLAAQKCLVDFSEGPLNIYYNRAGIIASNGIKKAINQQDFAGGGPNNEGPAESTLKARKSKGFTGKKSLIVTGQMRNAITYVIQGDE